MIINLSPFEKDRIIADNFGLTEMGRDLLAQDYFLKQLAASLTDPDTTLGKEFWRRIYQAAFEKFGTVDVPTDTMSKVWIVPGKAVIHEKGAAMYVAESHLKVMTESDYFAMQNAAVAAGQDKLLSDEAQAKARIANQVMREVIVPAIEKEVNEGKSFAPLRQVFSGMLLATWYKLALKESVLAKVYGDRSRVKGIDQDPAANQAIYEQYLAAFRKGVVNMIREDADRFSDEIIPRKYFSGGFDRNGDLAERVPVASLSLDPAADDGVGIQLRPSTNNNAAQKPDEITLAQMGLNAWAYSPFGLEVMNMLYSYENVLSALADLYPTPPLGMRSAFDSLNASLQDQESQSGVVITRIDALVESTRALFTLGQLVQSDSKLMVWSIELIDTLLLMRKRLVDSSRIVAMKERVNSEVFKAPAVFKIKPEIRVSGSNNIAVVGFSREVALVNAGVAYDNIVPKGGLIRALMPWAGWSNQEMGEERVSKLEVFIQRELAAVLESSVPRPRREDFLQLEPGSKYPGIPLRPIPAAQMNNMLTAPLTIQAVKSNTRIGQLRYVVKMMRLYLEQILIVQPATFLTKSMSLETGTLAPGFIKRLQANLMVAMALIMPSVNGDPGTELKKIEWVMPNMRALFQVAVVKAGREIAEEITRSMASGRVVFANGRSMPVELADRYTRGIMEVLKQLPRERWEIALKTLASSARNIVAGQLVRWQDGRFTLRIGTAWERLSGTAKEVNVPLALVGVTDFSLQTGQLSPYLHPLVAEVARSLRLDLPSARQQVVSSIHVDPQGWPQLYSNRYYAIEEGVKLTQAWAVTSLDLPAGSDVTLQRNILKAAIEDALTEVDAIARRYAGGHLTVENYNGIASLQKQLRQAIAIVGNVNGGSLTKPLAEIRANIRGINFDASGIPDAVVTQRAPSDTTGGIDLAQSALDLQIKRDGNGVPLPASQQDLDNIMIDGLVPELLYIKPAASVVIHNFL
ncbi:MAG: hypothetical protein HQL20_06120 [Candidatus Omnitrophica bacterium]|nr:hypothetical protein [Candidatus Omnitrophota bacterium]